MKSFDSFTNLYSLSKTLKFEMRPVGNTQKMLDNAGVFEKDKLIQKKYGKTKPYFDRLHREFIEEALTGVELIGLDENFRTLVDWQKDKKNNVAMKAYENSLQRLRTEIGKIFNLKAEDWVKNKYPILGLKNKNTDILFEEAVFGILKARYGEEKDTFIEVEEIDKTGKSKINQISIFDSWKGFTGYFKKFFETRKNFYKNDGTSTAIATRIIDQNLKRFIDNLSIVESVRQKVDLAETEKSFSISLSQFFSIDFYNKCLLQDGIDYYNKIIGGETLKNGEKLIGLNELINQYRQNNKDQKIPFFKLLDKQILSEKILFLDEIKNDTELIEALSQFAKTAEEKTKIVKKLFADFVENNSKYDLAQIYISQEAFNTISNKWTSETETFAKYLFEAMKSGKLAKYEKKDNSYKFPDFIALSQMKSALLSISLEGHFWKEKYYKISKFQEKTNWEQFLAIFLYEFNSLFSDKINTKDGETKQVGYYLFAKDLHNLILSEQIDIPKDSKVTIKDFADSVLTIYQMAKYFAVEKKRAWLAEYELDSFYTQPDSGYLQFYDNAYEDIVQVYNKLRNYLTKKPYSEEKWKLNFENSTLANGWDKNKESDNSAVILQKGGKYYLGLITKGHNKIFDDRFQEKFIVGIEGGKYEKIVYKFFPDQAKMFPKVCFSAKGLEFFRPSEEILRIYNNAEFKKGETYSIDSMQKLIDFYKDCLTKYEGWACYTFRHLKPTEEYQNNIGEFFRDVAEDGYRIDFQGISDQYIHEKNEKGELHLFEIHNKDWNLDKARDGKSKTTQKNLHTLYFESLFSNDNVVQNFPIKLNGQAEIFYRPKTEKDKLESKKDKKGNKVIDHKRYSENKIFFHVPLTLNRTKNDSYRFNAQINNFLANNKDINIIGVDRGEKHLVYYSVITQASDILESGSLNELNGVNYAEKLGKKAENREQARRDWQDVQGIKDLKKGYISQVVRKLADLAIKHNAIIILEDLNMRFKQVRGGIEKSIYQQLEKALIDKLSFLVDKGEKNPEQAGHLLKAYQLSAPFETFQKMGKQTGIIFYTQASYTSKSDPVTGWRPHLYLKYFSAKKAKDDIAKFTKIEFVNDRFELTYDIKDFQQAKEYPNKTVWKVCSNVERFRWDKNLNQNKGGYTHYTNITENIQELFTKYGIDITKDLLTQISTIDEKQNTSFFRDFIFYFNLICQIRNTDDSEIAKKNGKDDFILSPVEPFFDSRKDNGNKLPENGDDNGAYNIARKGIVILNKISQYSEKNENCEKMKWGDLYVSNIDWDNFVTQANARH